MGNQLHLLSFFSKNSIRLLLILFILHALFFCFALQYQHIYLTVDSTEYLNQAKNLKTHGSWYAGNWNAAHDDFLKTRRPPLYAVFLFGLKGFFQSDYFVLIIQNLISIFCLLLAYYLAQLTARKEINFWWFVLPLFFFSTQFIYANMIMADVLFQLFILLAVFSFYRFAVYKKVNGFLWFNVCIALAILTKPVLYLFWVVIAVFTLLLFTKNLLAFRHTFFAAIPFAVVLSLSAYNYHQTGLFHYSSVNQKFVSEYGAYLSVGERGNAAAQLKIDSILAVAHSQPDFKNYSAYLDEQSKIIIKKNFGRFLIAQCKGMVQFFVDHGRWDLMAFFVNPDFVQQKGLQYYYSNEGFTGVVTYLKTFNLFFILYLLLATIVNIFLVYALLCFFLNTHISYIFRLMVACIIFYQVVFTSVVGCSRYRMAVYPLLLMAATMFVINYITGRKNKIT